jgi:hypothetical protein
LEARPAGGWLLFPCDESAAYRHARAVVQPGQPASAEWTFDNPDDAQPLQFKLKAAGGKGALRRPRLEIDGYLDLVYDVELRAGQTLLCEGGREARVYDDKGRQIAVAAASAAPPALARGTHRIGFEADFSGGAEAVVTFRTRGAPEIVPAR